MNKEDFLKELEKNLRNIDAYERNEVLNYYNEYIDDLSISENGLANLPNPKQVANQILADAYIKNIENTDSPAKKGASTIALIFSSILAAPIALPLALALVAIAFSVVIVVVTLVLSLYFCAIAFILTGILSIAISFIAIFKHFLTFVFLLGIGFITLSLGILLFSGMSRLVKSLTKKISTFFVKKSNNRKVAV